jgi:hypothetical protein
MDLASFLMATVTSLTMSLEVGGQCSTETVSSEILTEVIIAHVFGSEVVIFSVLLTLTWAWSSHIDL